MLKGSRKDLRDQECAGNLRDVRNLRETKREDKEKSGPAKRKNRIE